jgi:hypothetical protein
MLVGEPGIGKTVLCEQLCRFVLMSNGRPPVQRLSVEIEGVLSVNGLPSITTEVVAFARESLVIGTP